MNRPTTPSYHQWVIAASFFIAFFLELMPSPVTLAPYRPMWPALVFFYWLLLLPHRINVGTAFFVGLVWDLILSAHWGVRAFALSFAAYLMVLKFPCIKNLPVWQQSIAIGAVTFITELLIIWGEFLTMNLSFAPERLWSHCLNGLIWPALTTFLNYLCRNLSHPLQ